VAPVGRFDALSVRALAGTSLASEAVTVNCNATSSSTVLLPIGARIGASFTSLTVIVTSSVSFSGGMPLSVTVKVTTYWPCWDSVGVQANTPVAGVNVAPVGRFDALSVRALAGTSFASEAVTVNCNATSSSTVLLPIEARIGASFTDVTVSTNVSTAEPPSPSVTVTVIVAVPNWLAAGVTVTVRSAPLPPNTMLAFGTNVVLDELPVRTKSATGVSASPTVNDSAAVLVSSSMVWSAMSLIVGRVLSLSVICTVTPSMAISS